MLDKSRTASSQKFGSPKDSKFESPEKKFLSELFEDKSTMFLRNVGKTTLWRSVIS
jgi:hypothetical protein